MLPEVNSIYSAMLRMGLLVIVASCLLAHGVASPSDINGEINSINDGANPGFATRVADEDAQHLLQIASAAFKHSVDCLFASKQFASQYVERPGLAKELSVTSDREWENGMEGLKKYFQRGGDNMNAVANNLKFGTKPSANAASPSTQADQYLQRMEGLLGYDTARFQKLTALHAATTRNSQDYELGHWLDGHLENQADRIYDMEQRLQQLRPMRANGMAMQIFDGSW